VFLIVAAFLVGTWVDGDRGGATDPPADVRGRIPIGLVGMPYQAAQARLLEIGYPSSLELQHSDTVPQYHVIKSEPDEGSNRNPGESVTLYVSMGPAAKATVPGGLLGKDYTEVSQRLLRAGFAVERAEDYSDIYDSGEVMEVRPAEGSLQEPGSTVEVTISLGSKDSSSSDPSSSDPSLSDSSSESGG
jgi:beta-lactam-binding protein with PASTA domain